MLSFLQIRNFAIVESLELEFSGGFTCVTGETGAGKSILVDALGLLCGDRADSSAIRSGASRAELAADFQLAPDNPAWDWLKENGLDDDTNCLLRRTMSENGRSRAWVNGTAVTLRQLSSLGSMLVEIHGQNEHILLAHSKEQFRLLDGCCTYGDQLSDVRTRYEHWLELDGEMQTLLDESPLDAGDMDLMRYQVRELESTMIPADDFRAAEAEYRILSRGGVILDAIEQSLRALEDEQSGAGQSIHSARAQLETHADLDPDISAAVALLSDASIACNEAMASLQAARSRLDISPHRLTELEQKLSGQHDLARKHRVEPDALERVLEKLKNRYSRAETRDDRLEELKIELDAACEQYRQAALVLYQCRKQRSEELAHAVTALMQELGMEGGRFEFQVRHDPQCKPSANGSDRLELRVSANPGIEPGLLRKVASGGELSRISLAIKVASKAGSSLATQVFDEVDAGIGGDTAHAVGALLKSLSANGQALCVTHLAQVAVFADHQLQVRKSSGDSETRVETHLLASDARVDEIARMLGGRLSDQSRAHASELLATASTRH